MLQLQSRNHLFISFLMVNLSVITLSGCSPNSDLKGGGGVGKQLPKNNQSWGSSKAKDIQSDNAPGSADNAIGEGGTEAPSGSLGSASVSSGPSTNLFASTVTPNVPQGISQVGSVSLAAPDLKSCASLRSNGKQGDGTCKPNQVVVIVNDGNTKEMTCCPVGLNVLSSSAAETHIIRSSCSANEVATGVKRPDFYCTKINTTYLKLSAPSRATYTSSTNGLSNEEKSIADSYNQGDTCICRNSSVVVGPHSMSDNQCTEKCVQILVK